MNTGAVEVGRMVGERATGLGARSRGPVLRLLSLWPLLLMGVLAVLAVSVYKGWHITHPPRLAVTGDPATQAYLDYRILPCVFQVFSCGETLFTPGQHIPISGWIIPSVPNRGYPSTSGNWSQNTVIFVGDHGQNRTSTPFPFWDVSTVLNEMGYNVVLFDTEGTGDSGGADIGFGTLEVRDLDTVVKYLQGLGAPQGNIAVWGLGTGADTAILAAARDRAITAVIADSPYLTPQDFLRRAVPGWTGLPTFPFAHTVLWAMQEETGVNYGSYDPLRAIPQLGKAAPPARPLLLVVGSQDVLTPPADTNRLLAASHDNNALSLEVMGAGHLQAFARSRPSKGVPGLSQYMCDALDTLKAMQAGTSPGQQEYVAPCGGASAVLAAPNVQPLPASVGGQAVGTSVAPGA